MTFYQRDDCKPLVGVFISKKQANRLLKQLPHPRLSDLAEANDIAGTNLYFFSLKEVLISKKTIYGIFYDKDDYYWKRKPFPYPSVLYKLWTENKLNEDKYLPFMTQLTEENIHYINYPHPLNKWKLYNHLQACNELKDHLPDTRLLYSADVLNGMLAEYGTLYVKAAVGSRGEQVVKITDLEDGQCLYSYYKNGGVINRSGTPESVYHYVIRLFKTEEIISQAAIDLIEVNGSISDFRAEVQRDGSGKLEVTAVPVRLSRQHSPITTHARSYTFEDFHQAYMRYTPEEIAALKERTGDFAKRIYECVEKKYGPVGELGIDLAIDKSGKLWYIETNAQSAKVSLYKAYRDDIISRASLNPLQYANYLHSSKNKIPRCT
ncbi:YheC/YheD family protein [Salipaludibacillus sp. CUR1]|uniref:YheC/YheD family endospore coat-associated protein n=1 Tax=Salipaludibacillus sp. CUR1 TaxID=2820003 RepID=UPI001E363307|nr:YheC/YheD family protein [Salipaludibacillus sp. CUR1]